MELKVPRGVTLDNIDPQDIMEHMDNKRNNPFKVNHLLEDLLYLNEDLLRSQTPKWVNYLMLGLVALTLVISILALLRSYGF